MSIDQKQSFEQHLTWASRKVSAWPAWKKQVFNDVKVSAVQVQFDSRAPIQAKSETL